MSELAKKIINLAAEAKDLEWSLVIPYTSSVYVFVLSEHKEGKLYLWHSVESSLLCSSYSTTLFGVPELFNADIYIFYFVGDTVYAYNSTTYTWNALGSGVYKITGRGEGIIEIG